MIKGYVINQTERSMHIFKKSVSPGTKVPLKELYETYKTKYKGDLDKDFVEWFRLEKLPKEGWGLVIVGNDEEKSPVKEKLQEDNNPIPDEVQKRLDTIPLDKLKPVDKITALEISELKHKDNPRSIIRRINSVHKLRRAQSLCKGRSGKTLILKYIRERINELKK